jgi:hypothetical protein
VLYSSTSWSAASSAASDEESRSRRFRSGSGGPGDEPLLVRGLTGVAVVVKRPRYGVAVLAAHRTDRPTPVCSRAPPRKYLSSRSSPFYVLRLQEGREKSKGSSLIVLFHGKCNMRRPWSVSEVVELLWLRDRQDSCDDKLTLRSVGLIGGYWRQIFKYVAEPDASPTARPADGRPTNARSSVDGRWINIADDAWGPSASSTRMARHRQTSEGAVYPHCHCGSWYFSA